ncbi:MAG: guanylate kinase [Clostridiales bacterium]|nr:guanylate kinase [Clostridiales bacterium]
MNQTGVMVVVSGFSGVGKGTIIKSLVSQYDNYALSISATSRMPRKGECDGVHYFFKTREQFEQMIQEKKLIEYAQYVNNYYGTPADYVFSQMEAGKDVILEIEVQGALQIKHKYPQAVLVFIAPPSAAELERRLVGRGTEPEETIRERLTQAARESYYMDRYDYIIVNDKLEHCVSQLHDLIQCQHDKCAYQQQFIEDMKDDLKIFLKGE